MAAPTPPRTPTARKSLPGTPIVITPSATALGSPLVIQKRKWQGDNVSLPLQGLTQPENIVESVSAIQMTPEKKRRVGEENKVEYLTSSSAGSPLRPPQFQQTNQTNTKNNWPHKVFLAAIQSNCNLLSGILSGHSVNSQRVDNIAHAMWQVVFNYESMMQDVTTKAAMFSQLKLRALAKLNYLPSWWFIREMACMVMKHQGWQLDDSEMQILWQDTVEWCKRMDVRMGMQHDGIAIVEQHGEGVVQEGSGRGSLEADAPE